MYSGAAFPATASCIVAMAVASAVTLATISYALPDWAMYSAASSSVASENRARYNVLATYCIPCDSVTWATFSVDACWIVLSMHSMGMWIVVRMADNVAPYLFSPVTDWNSDSAMSTNIWGHGARSDGTEVLIVDVLDIVFGVNPDWTSPSYLRCRYCMDCIADWPADWVTLAAALNSHYFDSIGRDVVNLMAMSIDEGRDAAAMAGRNIRYFDSPLRVAGCYCREFDFALGLCSHWDPCNPLVLWRMRDTPHYCDLTFDVVDDCSLAANLNK